MRKFLAVVLCAAALVVASAQVVPPVLASVTLAWDANSEPDVAGYRIYYKQTAAPTPWKIVNVGNVTNTTLSDLTRGIEYSFYATCYNTSGLESEPSNVVTYTAPKPPAAPRNIRITGSGG